MIEPLNSRQLQSFTPEKLVTLSTVALLISIGLCGAGSRYVSDPLLYSGFLCLGASLLGFAAALVWRIVRAISGRRKP